MVNKGVDDLRLYSIDLLLLLFVFEFIKEYAGNNGVRGVRLLKYKLYENYFYNASFLHII